MRFMIASDPSLSGGGRPSGPRVRAGGDPFLLLTAAAVLGLVCLTQEPQAAEPLEPYEQTIPNTLIKFQMLPVPGGIYVMSDPTNPGSQRRTILRGFWIGKTEVSWAEYEVYMYKLDEPEGATQPASGADAFSRPSPTYGPADRGLGHDGYAALGMSYHGAEQYCRWLSFRTGKKYRLPTEAEWEYACRAVVLPAGPIEDKALLDGCAWYAGNAEGTPHPMATKQPNAWGLYDMLGNLAEWCRGIDGTPVVRGGSYVDPAEKVHPAAREHQTPAWTQSDPQIPKSTFWLTDGPFVGFRVVCEN